MNKAILQGSDPPRGLEEEARYRTLLLNELNHRSKNIMQSIASTLSLQARRARSPEVRAELNSAVDRLTTMAEVQAMLYQFSGKDLIPILDYLGGLCERLGRGLHAQDRRVRLEIRGDNPGWPESTVVVAGFLVAELVINALKHGFPSDAGGCNTVTVTSGVQMSLIAVSDDGVGFDLAHKQDGLGSRLVEGFARRLGGKAEQEAGPGNGARTHVLFPTPGAGR